MQIYYQKNKTKILEQHNKTTKCEICGCFIQNQWIKRHQQTKKHRDNELRHNLEIKVDEMEHRLHNQQ
jgi:hypothetical protein